VDDAGGKEDWRYQNEMLKENLKAMLDQHWLESIVFGIMDNDAKQVLTITLLPKEDS